jgi:hypothetical protein
VVDLSSGEEDTFPDTSRNEEIARKLFSDLNRGLLGLPSDDNVILLSDSNEEEEVYEDDCADAEAVPSSIRDSPAPTASVATADNAPDGVQDDSNDSRTPDRVQNASSNGGDESGSP